MIISNIKNHLVVAIVTSNFGTTGGEFN